MSTPFMTRGALRAGTAVALTIAGMAACETDRASLLEPYGAPALNFPIVAPAAASAGLPGGSVSITRPATGTGTARITLQNLERISGGVYQVWLGTESNGALTNVVPATGALSVITTNATGGRDTARTANASSFAGVDDATARYVIDLTAASLGSDPATGRTVALVTIEGAAGATTPGASSPKPLWARFTAPAAGASANGTFAFGNYDADAARQYVYPLSGRGRAAVRGNALFVEDSSKGRPPLGYYYAAYAVEVDEDDAPVDTLAIGEFTAPWPRLGTSLRDADRAIVDEVVTDRPFAIAAAALRYTGPASLTFAGVPSLRITLKNKLAPAEVMPPNAVLTGALPAAIVSPEE